jgi:Eukaryotic membrane protein family
MGRRHLKNSRSIDEVAAVFSEKEEDFTLQTDHHNLPELIAEGESESGEVLNDADANKFPTGRVNSTIWGHLQAELTNIEFEGSFDAMKTERILNFLNVPFQIEKLMVVGYLVCLDSFLYIFTILPLRIIIALFVAFKAAIFRSAKGLQNSQKTDCLKGALVFICCYFLQYVDASKLYHSIRGQAIIKLYVIFNVLEVMMC